MLKIVNCTECLKNKLYKIYKKTLAFTLAETLIVMGIIGVVAALTLPNLNQSTGNKEKVAKVKKVYQNLTDAMGRVEAVYGHANDWYTANGNAMGGELVGKRMLDFMKVSKECGSGTKTGICKHNSTSMPQGYVFIMADGTYVDMYDGEIFVDIDGPTKGANTLGKDIFRFQYFNGSNYGEIIPNGQATFASNATSYVSSCTDCTAWVVMNDNMDYLKCRSSLSATNTTCK